MKNILIFISFIFVFLSNNLHAQDIKVEIDAPKCVEINSPFKISYTINLAKSKVTLTPPDFGDFDLLAGPSISSEENISVINGETSRNHYTIYSYILISKTIGGKSIGAPKWQADSTDICKTVVIEVLDKEAFKHKGDSVKRDQKAFDPFTPNKLSTDNTNQESVAFKNAADYTISAETLYVLREKNPAKFKVTLADNMLLTYGYVTDIIEETESEYNPLFSMITEKTYYDVVIENSIIVRVELDSEVARISKGDTIFALVVNSGKTKYTEKLPILTPVFSRLKSDFFINNRFCFFESLNDVRDFMVKTRTSNIHSSYFTVKQGDNFYFQNLLKL